MPELADSGLRQQKKLQTRAALERQALALAAKIGFDALTVDAIAAVADVSPSTFFRYFESKEAVILQAHIDRLGVVAEVLESSDPAGATGEVCRVGLRRLADLLTDDRAAVLEMMGVVRQSDQLLAWGRARQHVITTRIARWLADRQELPTDDVRPWLFAQNIIGIAAYSLISWTDSGATKSLHRIMEEALKYAETGLELNLPTRATDA